METVGIQNCVNGVGETRCEYFKIMHLYATLCLVLADMHIHRVFHNWKGWKKNVSRHSWTNLVICETVIEISYTFLIIHHWLNCNTSSNKKIHVYVNVQRIGLLKI